MLTSFKYRDINLEIVDIFNSLEYIFVKKWIIQSQCEKICEKTMYL